MSTEENKKIDPVELEAKLVRQKHRFWAVVINLWT